ncbi:hypothetical protein AKJ52_01955 [candidate division MSBL1 archaeon SCGC-AAA382C18]|uniref:Uncharacterized protein n=1 Tax=candidate division MSBL1 archaeon SCGC-AAA382C18 TaxID=1698281 RepID=A0A133VJJ5_9EURY|nr:hypothetical protein AKJ52_01955 [candidate division MSBL1 archaeon SCGC-AAA382C18]
MKKLELEGQGSIEYLLMFALFLTILAAFTIPSMINPARSSSEKIRKVSEAKVACDQIASSINNITYQENGIDTLGISISGKWTLKIDDSNPPMFRILVRTDDKKFQVKNELDYGFDDNVTISSGDYRIIIKHGDDEKINTEEDNVKIILNPG